MSAIKAHFHNNGGNMTLQRRHTIITKAAKYNDKGGTPMSRECRLFMLCMRCHKACGAHKISVRRRSEADGAPSVPVFRHIHPHRILWQKLFYEFGPLYKAQSAAIEIVLLTSSTCHPKFVGKERCNALMTFHEHCFADCLLVLRKVYLYCYDCLCERQHFVDAHPDL